MTSLDWISGAVCAARPDLPWTAGPGTYPDVLAGVMTDLCGMCDGREACAAYAAEEATAGFWAGSWRTHPDEPAQPGLPFKPLGDAA